MTTPADLEAALVKILTAPDDARRALIARLGEPPTTPRRGGVSRERAALLSGRNDRLRRLRHVVPGWRELSVAELASEVDAAARKYQAHRWPRERIWAGPPQGEPAATFWRILQIPSRIPGKRQISQILSDEIQ